MSYIKNYFYKDIPFSSETPSDEFYKYINVEDLGKYCTNNKDKAVKCRTVGILHSCFGKYTLTTMNNPEIMDSTLSIRVSLRYLEEPPHPAVVPYPVQIFGYLQFIEKPVLLPTLMQMMSISIALRMDCSLQNVQKYVADRISNSNDNVP